MVTKPTSVSKTANRGKVGSLKLTNRQNIVARAQSKGSEVRFIKR